MDKRNFIDEIAELEILKRIWFNLMAVYEELSKKEQLALIYEVMPKMIKKLDEFGYNFDSIEDAKHLLKCLKGE